MQHSVQVKEVKLRPRFEAHEYEFKTRHVRQYIDEGYGVRITIRFGGGGTPPPESERAVFDRVRADLEDVAQVESGPEMKGGTMTMILAPLKTS